jgi:hypothetical protein
LIAFARKEIERCGSVSTLHQCKARRRTEIEKAGPFEIPRTGRQFGNASSLVNCAVTMALDIGTLMDCEERQTFAVGKPAPSTSTARQ